MDDVTLFKDLLSWDLKDFSKMICDTDNVNELKKALGIANPKELIDFCRVTSFKSMFNGKPLMTVLNKFYKELSNELSTSTIS